MSPNLDQQALDLINAWEAGAYLHPAQKKAALQVAIRAALAQARAEGSGWQPIETAPRGEIVLFVYPPDGKSHLDPKYGVGSLSEWSGHTLFFDWGWSMRPTHWMPLPTPPRALAEGGHE